MALQRSAGNSVVDKLLAASGDTGSSSGDPSESEAAELSRSVETTNESTGALPARADPGRPSAAATGGRPLPVELRRSLEVGFGVDLDPVRLHTDAEAARLNRDLHTRAITHNQDIYLGEGEFAPDVPAGRQLLAHEVTHTLQQRGSGTTSIQADPKPGDAPARKKIIAVTLYRDQDVMIVTMDDGTSEAVTPDYNGKPNPGTYQLKRVGDHISFDASSKAGGVAKDGWILKWSSRLGTTDGVDAVTLEVIPGTAGTGGGAGAGGGAAAGGGTGTAAKSPGTATATGGGGEPGGAKKQPSPGGTGQSPQPSSSGRAQLSPEEQQRWDALWRLTSGAREQATEDPAELLRLYQVLRDTIEDPQFAEKGEPWIRFARFLDKNKDKIEGIIKGKPAGKLTQAKLEQIIQQYGKFIVGEPLEDPAEKLETVEDFDKKFEYNPNWQKMSKEDKKLLLNYAKMAPDEISKAPIDFSKVTTDMKVAMALKLSTSWPKEVAEAAKNAFTDPAFIVMLVLTIGIYVGLWLTPDPSFVTKLAAGTLTVVMLAQFGWEDIYGTAKAWSELQDRCAAATTVEQLKKAGDLFAAKAGAVGFDILLFIATWGLGKAIGPKVSKIGAERGVARAETSLKTAETKPGSGVPKQAVGEATNLLNKAAKPTASATLDALADLLPADAKQGLSGMRSRLPSDLDVLRALQSELAKGNDLSRFLSEKAVTPEVRAKAQADLLEARAKLARAKLIEAETIKDPDLRRAVRTEQINNLKALLQQLGIINDPKVQRAIKAGDINELTGELGEAIQRTRLRSKYPPSGKYTILSNIEIARLIPGFDSIAKWQAAEKAAGRSGDPGGLYERNGQLWKSVGNADALVAEPGANGKFRPVEVEEAKTGRGDSATKAAQQVAKVTGGLADIAAGKTDVRIFDRVGKNQIGRDLTDQFDLSQLGSLKSSTRGPEGRGFQESLGYDEQILRLLAESLIKSLPPAAPQPALPPLPSKRDQPQPATVSP
jgi:hypothetical protein